MELQERSWLGSRLVIVPAASWVKLKSYMKEKVAVPA
jgi:hypothetical protein